MCCAICNYKINLSNDIFRTILMISVELYLQPESADEAGYPMWSS